MNTPEDKAIYRVKHTRKVIKVVSGASSTFQIIKIPKTWNLTKVDEQITRIVDKQEAKEITGYHFMFN